MEDGQLQSTEQGESADISAEEERRLKSVVDIFSRLSIACKSRTLYPAEHPTAIDAVILLHAVIEDSLRNMPSMVVKVGKDSLVYERWVVGQRMESLRALASRIRSLNIQEITINAGASFQEAEALVELLASDPDKISACGGPEAFLFTRGVGNIAVVESEARRVDMEEGEESFAGEDLETAPEDVELQEFIDPELFKDLLKLLLDPEELARVIMMLSGEEGQPLSKEELADAAFVFLKSAFAIVRREHPGRTRECLRSMAESLLFLDIDVRNSLLVKNLLPKLREEPVCSALLTQFNSQEIADVLANFLPLVPELTPKSGHLLKAIGFEDAAIRQALGYLRVKLVDLGQVSPDLLASLETGGEKDGQGKRPASKLPSLEEVGDILGEYLPEELEELNLISQFDPGVDMLTDTTPMLLGLLEQGGDLDNPQKTVEQLQQNFWGLAMSAQLDMAALVLEKVSEIVQNDDPAIDPYRSDLVRMLEEAASETAMQQVIKVACSRRDQPLSLEELKGYVRPLGDRGIDTMVETLGVEEDMYVRKCIVDTLAELCRERIPMLGSYMDDPRWYLVRNIVSIMARFHSPEIIPYLRRAFDHPNPKVRAEAIRALGMIGGHAACALLQQGLRDEDETTRILCIRWLGRLEDASAATRLIRMLEDKEPGGDSLAVKKEIISSLGQIKAPESYSVLRKYKVKQKRLNRAEWQEINNAAAEALRRLLERYPHLEGTR